MALIPDRKGGFIISGDTSTGVNQQASSPAQNLSMATTTPTPTTPIKPAGQVADSSTPKKIQQAQPDQQAQTSIQQQLEDINAQALKIKAALDKQAAPDGTITDASKVADAQTDITASLGSDKAISDSLAKLQADTQAYTNSTATTRVQDYQNLLDQQGIPGLQTQLVDMENIINGSEQDIRNEIQSGGGVATESQIQALTTARNKNLILRYNGLQNLLASKEALVDKIVTLSGEDRKDVSDRLNAQMGLDEKQLQMNIDLQKSKATEDLAFQRFIQSSQNTALTKAMEMAKAGALTGASPERLQQLSDNAGGLIEPGDLAKMNDYAVNHQDAQLTSLLATINTKQETISAAKENAQAILAGNLFPSQLGYRDKALAYAEIRKIDPNFNIGKAETEYQATLTSARSMNSQRFANFQFRSQTVLHTIDNMRQLSKDLKKSGLAVINKASLYAASQGIGPKADIAAKYIAQTGLLQEDLANLFMGNASPTDSSLSLAQKVLNENWNDAQLNAALDTLYDNVQFRSSALASVGAIGGVGSGTDSTSTSSVEDLRAKYSY